MRKTIAQVAFLSLFIVYFFAVLEVSDFWGYILSPTIVLLATFIIFWEFCLKAPTKLLKRLGLLLTLAILSWAIADIILAFNYFSNINSSLISLIADSIYGFTNIFLFIMITIYLINKLKNTDISNALLNVSLVSAAILVLIWVIFFDSNLENLFMLKVNWYDSILLVVNFFIFMEVSIYFVSIRRKKIPLNFIIFPIGIILFVVSDMTYYYQIFFTGYRINSVLDALYVFSFVIMANGLIGRIKNYQDELLEESKNVLHNGYWALFSPVLIVVFDGFNFKALFIVSSLVAIYFLISSILQKNIYQKELINIQEKLNRELEAKVEERTKELNNTLNTHPITGLYNSRYFINKLDKEILEIKDDEKIILLYIEIDRFRTIKMIYGDSISSILLKNISKRLKSLEELSGESILTTYEEGVFFISERVKGDYQIGVDIANQVIEKCSDIYQIEDYNIKATVNIGISLYPLDSKTKEELIKNANIAMVNSRLQGDNEIMVFKKELGDMIYRQTKIAIRLKKINFDKEFFLNFQPQNSLINNKVIAFEVLLRWKTKEGELIPPGEFIPIAEESGSMVAVGDWVITQTLKQMDIWQRMDKKDIRIAINISAKQLVARDFLKKLKDEMKTYNVCAKNLELEITESIQLENNPETIEVLNEIKKMGISIAIDDFGTGYSSLYYLKKLPVDRIKIAKQLIDKIDKEPFEYAVAKAVIEIGKAMGVKIIAEGVETKEQCECLKELGCYEVQGYYFGKPESAEETYGRR